MLVFFFSYSLSANATEVHPKLQWSRCTKAGCTKVNAFVVHDKHIGDVAHRGADQLDYEKEVGVVTSGGTISQRLVSTYKGKKVIGSRLYLMTEDDKYYQLFNFVGKEITYTVDMSQIPCSVNAALYTSEMPKGGKPTKDDANLGAQGGTGYCDANCVDGGCCPEFDIQEASSKAMVFTAHTCQTPTNGCDSSGCGYNPYRDSKDKTFWAVGGKVDVSKPVTVVTQFVSVGTSLSEVKRKYVQGGKVIEAAQSLNDKFCNWNGGQGRSMSAMGASFTRGHVLVFSLWDGDGMSWMDGGNAGPCTSYSHTQVEATSPNLKVTWSNIKFGDIDSTY
uniref:cellulase n=1 Tax=uncultured symbiotic protist of Mastotermes darwiniensis TaxID=403661 RepID=A4UX16_9EUKA|nr:putative glycosyl hydrolase family7 [uncultured symbiotic protist of Mastotermes darwiniensis]